MVLGSLPYIRYVQLVNGHLAAFAVRPAGAGLSAVGWLWRFHCACLADDHVGRHAFEPTLRVGLFNIVSIFTGTGFFSGDFTVWGSFGMTLAFVIGLIGGCSSSSSGALSVFRVQVMLAAIAAAIRSDPCAAPGCPGEIRRPHGGNRRDERADDVCFGLYPDHRGAERCADVDRGGYGVGVVRGLDLDRQYRLWIWAVGRSAPARLSIFPMRRNGF